MSKVSKVSKMSRMTIIEIRNVQRLPYLVPGNYFSASRRYDRGCRDLGVCFAQNLVWLFADRQAEDLLPLLKHEQFANHI